MTGVWCTCNERVSKKAGQKPVWYLVDILANSSPNKNNYPGGKPGFWATQGVELSVSFKAGLLLMTR